jgi:ParB family chromosome partitioning protein
VSGAKGVGGRIDLSTLASVPTTAAPVPAVRNGTGTRALRLEQVAANPLNTRDMSLGAQDIDELAESLRKGQLESCAVVDRASFLEIFPEHEAAIGTAEYVQVTGNRRLVAARKAGLRTIDVTVKKALAASRLDFLTAMAAENLLRKDLDPIEQAHAVQLMVAEASSQAEVARQLGKSAPWVTQRLDLLKLLPELQQLLRAGTISIAVARSLALEPADRQMAVWEQLRAEQDQPAAPPQQPPAPPRPRVKPDAIAVRRRAISRLGASPHEVAQSLVDTLQTQEIVELVGQLQDLLHIPGGVRGQ